MNRSGDATSPRAIVAFASVVRAEFAAKSRRDRRSAAMRIVVAAVVFVIDKLRIPMIVVATFATGRMEQGQGLFGSVVGSGIYFFLCYLVVGETTHQAIRRFPQAAAAFRGLFPVTSQATLIASPGTQAYEDRIDGAGDDTRYGLALVLRKTAMGMALGTFVDASATTVERYSTREVRKSYAVTAFGTALVVVAIVAVVQHIVFGGLLQGTGLIGLFDDSGGHELAAQRTLDVVTSKWTWWGLGFVLFMLELVKRNGLRRERATNGAASPSLNI